MALGVLLFGMSLWVTGRAIGVAQLPYAILLFVATLPVAFLGTVFVYLVVGLNGLGLRKAIPFACFFLAGMTVARFQWHIAFDKDTGGLEQYYFEAIILVPTVSFVGLLLSVRYLAVDRLLALIIGMTLLLGLMQFLWEVTVIPAVALNLYARAYAATGIVLPFIALGQNHYVRRSKGAQREGSPDA